MTFLDGQTKSAQGCFVSFSLKDGIKCAICTHFNSVAYPGILFWGGGNSTNSVEDRGQRERGPGGGSPLVSGSGSSCNLVQGISFHIVKFLLIFGTLRIFMMTTNLFVIANPKHLRT